MIQIIKKRGKAQAAMEFLVTYGWVFIIVLGIVGVMNYYGIFRMDRLLPDSCFLSADLKCEAFSADYNEGLKLYIRNGLGYGIRIDDVHVKSGEGPAYGCSGTPTTGGFQLKNRIIDNNAGVEITIPKNTDCMGDKSMLRRADILKGELILRYYIDNSKAEPGGYKGTILHTVRGSIKVGIA